MKDCVLENVTKAQECCGDILADAKEINEQRAEKEEQAENPAAE